MSDDITSMDDNKCLIDRWLLLSENVYMHVVGATSHTATMLSDRLGE